MQDILNLEPRPSVNLEKMGFALHQSHCASKVRLRNWGGGVGGSVNWPNNQEDKSHFDGSLPHEHTWILSCLIDFTCHAKIINSNKCESHVGPILYTWLGSGSYSCLAIHFFMCYYIDCGKMLWTYTYSVTYPLHLYNMAHNIHYQAWKSCWRTYTFESSTTRYVLILALLTKIEVPIESIW